MFYDLINLIPGQHYRNVRSSFGPDNALDLSKLLIQNMPIKKQQRIEHLILG